MTALLRPDQIEDARRLARMRRGDDLRPARGIINGIILSIPMWILIGIIAWAVTR